MSAENAILLLAIIVGFVVLAWQRTRYRRLLQPITAQTILTYTREKAYQGFLSNIGWIRMVVGAFWVIFLARACIKFFGDF